MPSDEGTPNEPDRGPGLPPDPSENLGPDPPPDPSEGLVPDAAETTDFSDVDVSADLQAEFWGLVLIFNVALFAVSLGVMLIGFRGQLKLGGGLVVFGLAAFAHGVHKIRTRGGDD